MKSKIKKKTIFLPTGSKVAHGKNVIVRHDKTECAPVLTVDFK